MDCAKVSDRANTAGPVMTPEQYKMRENIYESVYPIDGHWMYGLPESGYSKIGEYAIDDDRTLYRFELDESKRKDSERFVLEHFVGVIITKKAKPAVMGMVYETRKCPTCGQSVIGQV